MEVALVLWVLGALVALKVAGYLFPASLWLRTALAGVWVPPLALPAMRFRGSDPYLLLPAQVRIVEAGVKRVELHQLEAHGLAGGDVEALVDALVEARGRGVPLLLETAAGVDLTGGDVRDYARGLSATALDVEADRALGLDAA